MSSNCSFVIAAVTSCSAIIVDCSQHVPSRVVIEKITDILIWSETDSICTWAHVIHLVWRGMGVHLLITSRSFWSVDIIMVYLVARCAHTYTTYHQAGLCQGYAPGAGHSALPGEVLPLYTTHHHVGTSTNAQCVIEHFSHGEKN